MEGQVWAERLRGGGTPRTPTQAWHHPTFQVADLRLTVRPLLVTVHFILMKKSRSVDISLLFFPKPEPGWGRVERTG